MKRETQAPEVVPFPSVTPFLGGDAGKAMRKKLWLGIGIAILLSVSLAIVKLVILKMLPFDNKSEFQVVVDMPVGTPLEKTSQVLHEISEVIAEVEEVADYQAYTGNADGVRRIVQIAEVQSMEGDVIVMQDVFKYQQTGFQNGKVQGQFKPTGVRPKFMEKLESRGMVVPPTMFSPRR